MIETLYGLWSWQFKEEPDHDNLAGQPDTVPPRPPVDPRDRPLVPGLALRRKKAIKPA